MSQRSASLTPEPVAPFSATRHGATYRPAPFHPAAVTAYQDGELRYELEQLLAGCLEDDAREIAISVVDGSATLLGSVATSMVRELAEALVSSIPELRGCNNRLLVRAPRAASIAA